LQQRAGLSDPAHDLAHIRRVVANARVLAAAEGARLAVVLPAAWLHDCVTFPKDSPLRKRASVEAASVACHFLHECGYPAMYHGEIAHAIEAHSFTAGIEPQTLEAMVVQDADRLDALGAIGIARCLMLGGVLGRPLYDEHDPFAHQRQPDDGAYLLDHFFIKLLRIGATMKTAHGSAAAQQRTALMRQFLQQLGEELGMHTIASGDTIEPAVPHAPLIQNDQQDSEPGR
jgi:uncharacterized protein